MKGFGLAVRFVLKLNLLIVGRFPVGGQPGNHAQTMHQFGIAQALVHKVPGLYIGGLGLETISAGREFLGQAEDQQHHRPARGHQAEKRMHQVNDQEVQGHPGSIEKGEHSTAGKVVPELIHVPQSLSRPAAADPGGLFEHFSQDPTAQALVHGHPDLDQKPGTQKIQNTQNNQTQDDNQGYAVQGGKTVAVQNPDVDDQHVDGKAQVQGVDEHAVESGNSEVFGKISEKGDHVFMRLRKFTVHG